MARTIRIRPTELHHLLRRMYVAGVRDGSGSEPIDESRFAMQMLDTLKRTKYEVKTDHEVKEDG